jgi:chromosome condensin MukBEF complex kleisin-like MukF subunit
VTYVDNLIDWGWRLGPSCHLIADTLDELHEFAARLGMSRSWFQDDPKLKHYDLTAVRRARAVRLGAIELDRRAFVAKMRELRKKDGS